MNTAFLVLALLLSSSILNAGQPFNDVQMKAIALSFTHEANGEYDKALTVLSGAGIPSEDYFLNLRSGWLLYRKQAYQDAIRSYATALKAQPRSIEALVGMLNCCFAIKDNVELHARADELLAIDPANYSAHRYLILSDIERKEYSKAELRLEEALGFYPIDLDLNLSLIAIYTKQSRITDARGILNMLEAIYGSQDTRLSTLRKTLE